MRWWQLLGLACVALPAAGEACAADGPVTVPTRDVDVLYRSVAGGRPVAQRSRYRAADGILRLDTPSPGLWMLVDGRAHTMSMVSDGDRGVVDMRLPAGVGPGGFSPGQNFTRRGVDVVAGLGCTEWDTVDSQGQGTTACYTDDGVLLRARHGASVLVEAARVVYGPLDPAAFIIPAGYGRAAGAARTR